MTLFKNKLLPLLLALCMVVTMLPMTALAAEIPEETTSVCTDEHCTHDHTEETPVEESFAPASIEESPVAEEMTSAETPEAPTPVDTPAVTEETPETPEVDELPTVETPAPENPEAPEIPAEANAYSGCIGDSAVAWELDPVSGRLFITGSGNCETFTSPDDQPWSDLRTEIREVWFNSMDALTIENLAYWFDGCSSLTSAEVPYTTPVIGTRTFANCPALKTLMLYYGDANFTIAQGAFASDTLRTLAVYYIAMLDKPMTVLSVYDWSADNRAAFFEDVYGTMLLASGYCVFCDTTCSYTVEYEQWSDTEHCTRHWCSNCGKDQCGGVNGQSHSYNTSGYCTYCGYYNSAYDQTTVCYHTSTYTTWSGCNWTKYCSNCGAYISSGTSHGSTYTTWNGCNWYDYCHGLLSQNRTPTNQK